MAQSDPKRSFGIVQKSTWAVPSHRVLGTKRAPAPCPRRRVKFRLFSTFRTCVGPIRFNSITGRVDSAQTLRSRATSGHAPTSAE